ncbi:MAG TPA: hypothetical protein VGH40_12835 [Roseiarcus sp.]|jgi:hypothetical protein
MPFAITLVGKILAGLASSETSASPAAQKTDTDNASVAKAADFSQTVDNVSRAAAGATQHGVHPGKS